jgi:hypothetical protein
MVVTTHSFEVQRDMINKVRHRCELLDCPTLEEYLLLFIRFSNANFNTLLLVIDTIFVTITPLTRSLPTSNHRHRFDPIKYIFLKKTNNREICYCC